MYIPTLTALLRNVKKARVNDTDDAHNRSNRSRLSSLYQGVKGLRIAALCP